MTQALIYSLTMRTSRVYETKFLGVIIDDRISWKAQIQAVKAKLSKTVTIMYRARCCLNETGMKILYFSLFMRYIDYSSEIWGNTYRSNIIIVYISFAKESGENDFGSKCSISYKRFVHQT